MNNLTFFTNSLLMVNQPYFWVNFSILTILLTVVATFVLIFVKKKIVTIFVLLNSALLLLSFAFSEIHVFNILLSAHFVFIAITLFINSAELRPLLANPLKKENGFLGFKLGNRGTKRNRIIYDRDFVFGEIETAVDYMSKTKTGAIITLQKDMALDEVIRNGQPINAPVSNMLLQTIFYKGTTLHDGAVVIRDNIILAAAVYYTASTKPLPGKVGSRHRAALGISEITDTVTIVVSEETGRISIAYKGTLLPVAKEKLVRVLTDYMDAEDEVK